MKMITLLFALIFSVTAYTAIGPVNRSTNLKYDGSIDSSTLEKEFINVVNREGSTISAGMGVYLDVTNDDGASVVIGTDHAGQPPLCIMKSSCANNALCQCQTYGYAPVALYDAWHEGGVVSAVAGQPFYLSTSTAGYLAARATILASNQKGGIFYDASSASGSIEVFVDLR